MTEHPFPMCWRSVDGRHGAQTREVLAGRQFSAEQIGERWAARGVWELGRVISKQESVVSGRELNRNAIPSYSPGSPRRAETLGKGQERRTILKGLCPLMRPNR